MMARNAAIACILSTGNQHYCFPMDTRAAPFNDNNVRLALKHALDRQEMVDKILYGYGAVGTTTRSARRSNIMLRRPAGEQL
jgi:peptide/nickel transport system substrate-binding protein